MKTAIYSGFLIIFIMYGVCYGQLPKASEFLPLQIGNVWQHQHKLGAGPVIQTEVVSDTLLGDTLVVYKALVQAFQNPPDDPTPAYFYYNHDSTFVYREYETFPDPPYNRSSLPLLDTSGGFGGTWEVFLGDFRATASITDTGTVSFFGERRKWLEVNLIEERGDSIVVLPGDNISFIEGIGISMKVNDTLTYAKIDGKEYGDRATSVQEVPQSNPLPVDFKLSVFPNPASTRVSFMVENVPEGITEVTIYNILGRKVRSLDLAGTYGTTRQTSWDGRDSGNQTVAGGIYFVAVKREHRFKTHKFTFLP